jgi:C-methyltransferase C-terminal domain/Putative zinc binding domain
MSKLEAVLSSRQSCRACGAPTSVVLSYGELPLANALLADCNPGSTERFPMTLVVCSSCRLVQLAETIAPAKLFRHYLYATFAERVHAFRPAFREFLRGLRRTGKSIAAYGASAKGATLLNFCNVDRDVIEFVVDRSPLKHGKAMPGIHLPIRPVEALLQRQPDYLLLLAWNFADEIMAQQAEYARRGGRFIMPLPTPHLTG